MQVSCIYQTADGYLWSGGFGGLSRFDGKLFVNYNSKSGLIDHNVNTIGEDDKGSIFIGTNKGISVLHKKKIYNYNTCKGITIPAVTSFCRGAGTTMYIGTAKGLFLFKDREIESIKKLENFKINCLYNPDSTSVFIGTDRGLVVYGHDRVDVLTVKEGLAHNKVNCITRFKNYLAIGTMAGLSLYDLTTQKFSNYFIEGGLIDENINALCNQNNTCLWVGSQNGLLRFDGRSFSYYNIGSDNNANHVRGILKDREDNIWIASHSGLFRYRDNSFSTFDKINGPGNAFIFQIFRDKADNLWLCSQNRGIYKYAQGYFKRYGAQEGLPSSECKAGIEDSEGRLIFATRKGLLRFNNERFLPLTLPKEFKGPYEMLYETRDKITWITGGNGVAALTWKDNTPVCKYYPLPTNKTFQAYSLCEDDEGSVFVGTSPAGLFKITGDSVINISTRYGIREEDYFALKFHKGCLFVATLNGVMVLNTKTYTSNYINEQSGLNSELVYALQLTENNEALWIGTNQGINKLNLKAYLANGKTDIVSYGKLQGFAGVECNSNGIWEDEDGSLWFGTVSGLVRHEPMQVKNNTIENTTLIQNIRLLNEDTLLLDDEVVLPGNLNTISFYYRGICLTNPDKVLYQKKLEGLAGDREWSEPSSEDYSKYANLAPGKYTFKVRSCNNEGIWNTSETLFSFRIKPPLYFTWWFILFSIILLFTLIYIIFMVRIYNIKKKQRLNFERKVEMSKIELKALRSQMNPHFVFNSLNSIQHYIFNTRSDEAIKYLNKFARLVRIILNNSERPTVTVGDDLEALKLYLELEQMRFEEKFDYEIIIDENVDVDYDIMPPLLMQPYVENAILHGLNPAPSKGKLTIRLSSGNNFLICTIEDNGIGREKASEIKRTMPTKNYKSVGMKITEDRLRILNEINNSKLSVTITDLKDNNNKPLGTKVELFVPLVG